MDGVALFFDYARPALAMRWSPERLRLLPAHFVSDLWNYAWCMSFLARHKRPCVCTASISKCAFSQPLVFDIGPDTETCDFQDQECGPILRCRTNSGVAHSLTYDNVVWHVWARVGVAGAYIYTSSVYSCVAR